MRRPGLLAAAACGAMLIGASAASAQEALTMQIAAAPALAVEEVCSPVTSVREGQLLWAVNPDGKTYDLLQIYFPRYGGPNTIAIIDHATGEVRYSQTDRGPNFHLCPAVQHPNGKLYISILISGLKQGLCVYDPATNELAVNAIALPAELLGETHPLALGTDEALYAIGQHPSRAAAAARIDPQTHAVQFFAPIGPSHAPNACWGYSGGADDRYVYVASGKVPWYLVAYDRQTGESSVLAETDPVGGNVSVQQGRYGCTARVTGLKGTGGQGADYWLYQGRAIPRTGRDEKPPWPQPDKEEPWLALPPKPEVSTAHAVPDSEGNAQIWVRTPQARAGAPTNPPEDAKPEDLGWTVFRLKVSTYPQGIYRLIELPDGRIFGTAGSYEGNFVFDPKTGAAQHLGKIHLSHYATTICDGLVYMSGYPTSPLYVYDPQKPWTANTPLGARTLPEDDPRSNPRRLVWMGHKEYAGTHKMYAAVTGADGRVYFGGQWIRDGAAGGLAWWDPNEQKAGGFWQAFSNGQINYMTTAGEGRYVVISTLGVDDPLLGKPKPEQGRLFVLDTTTREIVRTLDPVAKARGAGWILGVGGTRVLGWTENPGEANTSILYQVDVLTGDFAFRKVLPCALPFRIGGNQTEPFDYRTGPDGKVWTFMGGALVRINPADGEIVPVGRIARGGAIAFSGPDLYLAGETALRRIRGVVAR